jgi:hypothetical protein
MLPWPFEAFLHLLDENLFLILIQVLTLLPVLTLILVKNRDAVRREANSIV